MPRTHARFPEIPAGKGHYESFYLKACHPSEPLGVWIRYTVHKHSNQQPQGSLWFVLFDGAADGPRASKVTVPGPAAGDGQWIRIGEGSLGSGRLSGAAPATGATPHGTCASSHRRGRSTTCRASGCTARRSRARRP